MEKVINIKKNIKKGFTLVELLVVIAILAILASVSVVGYLGFTDKANQSKADSELAQAETELLSLCSNGSYSNEYLSVKYTFSLSTASGVSTISITYDNKVTSTETLDAVLQNCCSDLSTLEGTFSVDGTDKWLIYTLKDSTIYSKSDTLKIDYTQKTS